ncbi:hypothetical protein [Klebsiella phage vB_KvaP_F5M1D]|nr:hypothetical protein [Klebsiella phage vB_KvaP_F5M1D]
MAIERQAVQGLAPVQSTGGPRGSATQAIQVGTPQTQPGLGNFVDDLFNAAGSVAGLATDIMNRSVEDDKVVQYDRALRGLLPSDDATVGGTRAHMLVQLQNDVIASTAQLQEDAKRFTGDDAEWEQHVVKSRNAIQDTVIQKYPGLGADKETGKIITNAFMEQQPKVFAARQSAKLEREGAERAQSMQSRILLVTKGLSGEPLNEALHQLQQEALTMQLTKPEYEAMVADVALSKASVGDSSFIEATKSLKDKDGVSLYERNGKLMTGEISANRTWASLNQVELFEKKNAAIEAYTNGELNKDEMLQIMENHNKISGGTAWSDGEITTLFNNVAKQHAKTAQLADLVKRGEGGSPLGLQDISDKERKSYAEAISGVYTKLADDEILKTGATGEAAEAIRGKYERARYAKLGEQLIKDPNITDRYQALMSMSSANLKDMKAEPEAMKTLMQARDAIPEDARRAVMGDKEYAFVENYERATRMGYNPGQAVEFAQAASQGDKLPSSVLKELNSDVDGVVSDVAGGSWLTRGDNMSDMGKDLMLQDAGEIARAMKVAGHNNDTIKRHLTEYLKGQYSQLSEGFFTSGVLVKGDVRGLGEALKTNQKDMPLALRQYLNDNKQALLDASGGMDEKDLYFDVDMKRGLFTIRAGSGRTPVTPAMPLSEIKAQGLLKKYYESEVKARDDGNKAFREQQMKMGSWGISPTTVKDPKDVTAKNVGKMGISSFLMSPAFADGANLPSNFEFGYKENQNMFYDYVAKAENSINAGFDPRAGTYSVYRDEGGDNIGFGHLLTEEEKRNGYVTIGDEKVPFRQGQSELTPARARQLLEQDIKAHQPSTSGWAVPFDAMHPGVQRGILDLSYNLGKQGIANAPKAYADFKAGRFTEGFINMLDTNYTKGARSPGLLRRRAEAYNMAMAASGMPKITQVRTDKDGSMYAKFASADIANFLREGLASKIGKDGWLQVNGPSKLTENSRVGTLSV